MDSDKLHYALDLDAIEARAGGRSMTRAERLRAAAESEKLEEHVRVVMFAKDHGYVRFPGEDHDLLLVDYDSWLDHWSAFPSLKSHKTRDAAIRAGLIALADREERA